MINKHNQILLNKLVEISTGKQVGVVPAPKRLRDIQRQTGGSTIRTSMRLSPPMSSRQRGSSVGPKQSLNYLVRKAENERIEHENHRFAKRLYESKSILAKKEIDVNHIQQERYRKNLQKVTQVKPRFFDLSTMSKNNFKLPPLDSSQPTVDSKHHLEIEDQMTPFSHPRNSLQVP